MGTSGRVLVVDDYEPNLSAMRRLLERAGYSVITAMNGHEALETINRERLAAYATSLGMKLNLDRGDLDTLYRGAFLHDIGKIGIADRVLLKKGKLTTAERALMQQHPAVGDDLCSTVRSLDVVRPIVRH